MARHLPTLLRDRSVCFVWRVSLSDWTPIELSEMDDGSYQVDLSLPKGAYAYKFVEHSSTANHWVCDPTADLYQCDEGTGWQPECIAGQDTCNSVVRVDDCQTARLELTSLEHNGSELRLSAIGLDNSVESVSVTKWHSINAEWSDNTLDLSTDEIPWSQLNDPSAFKCKQSIWTSGQYLNLE